jgi:hypothetical protein
LDEALKHGDKSEAKHADGKPNSGLQLFKNDVGRNLEQDVGNEKDNKGIVVFGTRETELFRETEDVCIGDVHSIQEREQVHYAQERDNMEVDLPKQLGLCGVRWALNEFWSFIMLMLIARFAVDAVAWRLHGFYVELVSSVGDSGI